jgi:site-specific DNA-methyltransferase (adenine-specific)
MTVYYEDESTTLHLGDCLDVMARIPDNSIDAIVTDPPYGLGFMGKAWDALPPGIDWAEQCLRVLKPGGHVLAFGGTRTWHRLAVAIEDAGFEIRDSIAWLYGSGFPKSLDVSKAIERRGEVRPSDLACERCGRTIYYCSCVTEWKGWGTALKPAFEPVTVARKPLEGTVAANVLAHGTGALNIDQCRVATEPGDYEHPGNNLGSREDETSWRFEKRQVAPHLAGRWPTNVVLDESQAAELDRQSGITQSPPIGSVARTKGGNTIGTFAHEGRPPSANGHGDSGGASRFFPTFLYEAKAPVSERPRANDGSAHPTVKPLDLMRWLVRLVTPPGGTVLDPFMGSGTTAEACVIEGFYCIGIERDETYLPLAVARLSKPIQPDMFGGVA